MPMNNSPTVTITCLADALKDWAQSINHPCGGAGGTCACSTINDSPPCYNNWRGETRQARLQNFCNR